MSTPMLLVSEVACRDHEHRDECRYQVAWKINPHMQIGSVDFERACAQHAAFVDALVRAGATIAKVPFVHGAYDSVFAKDSALLLARGGVRRALLAAPRYPERACEQAARADVLARLGYEVVQVPAAATWEGGDIVMLPSGRALFLGHGERSMLDVAAWIEHQSGISVTPLELTDSQLYHLDTALAVLPDGTALVSDGGLSAHSMHALERAPGIRQIVTVPRECALAFGLNLISVNHTVFAGARVPRVQDIVESRGFRYEVVPLDEFHRAGGSAACLVAVVHGDAEPLRVARTQQQRRADLYGPVFRSVLLPIWESAIRRRPVVERWLELERTQWLPLEQLHAYQTRALGTLLARAYEEVPFYRRRFAEAGITPGDIKDVDGLAKLPILRRAELRATDRVSRVCGPTIRKQTSGTTGEPLVFGYEADSEHWRRAVKFRGYAWAGYRPGDRALHFWGAPDPTRPDWTKRAKVALDRRLHRDRYVHCAVMSDERLQDVVRLIETEQPQVIVCYAQAGAELARYINRNGLRTWPTVPVICGAERLLPRDRADLVEAFGPAVFDTYGCREVMMIGAECEAHDGLHLAMENVIVEIIVTENGVERPAREGETGEVVITDLHNFAMPFIRYANGDVATRGSARRCSCGRSLPRIQSVQGRMSETLQDRAGAPVSGIAMSFLVQDFGDAIRQFQAVQHRDRSVTISLVAERDLPQAMLDAVRRNGEQLLSGLEVAVQVVPQLPRNAAGKHQLVIVER